MIRFVIYTKSERGIASLQALVARGLIPTLCVSEEGHPETLELCRRHDVPVLVERRPKTLDHIRQVHESGCNLLVCAGYSKILPAALFEPLPHGAINCHGGRLPHYRGASPIPWQIIHGETHGAAYVLRMTAGIDDGPILAFEPYDIAAEDTARTVTDKVTSIFGRIVPAVVQQFVDGRPPQGQPQGEEGACHWTRRVPDDGLIDWTASAKQVVDLVRALDDPYPGAFVVHRGERLVIRRAQILNRRMAGVPGRCVGRSTHGTIVLARDGAVEILAVERNGVAIAGRDMAISYGDTFREGISR
jgi:methionyl-tRNA formyltransferase